MFTENEGWVRGIEDSTIEMLNYALYYFEDRNYFRLALSLDRDLRTFMSFVWSFPHFGGSIVNACFVYPYLTDSRFGSQR